MAIAEPVPPAEYHDRVAALRATCGDAELAGIVVWGKGGHSDSAADVFYLSNYYPRFNRSQAALVVPVEGNPTLFVDIADPRRDLITVDDIRFAFDVPAAVGGLVNGHGPRARFGLVGGAALLADAYLGLVAACGLERFTPMDEAVLDLRVIKSAAEIECLRAAATVGSGAISSMMEAALRPGTTEAEAVAFAYEHGVSRGCAPIDAMVASGSVSDYYCYGQTPRWSSRELVAGDLFHVDHAGYVGGYMFDAARSLVTGGRPSQSQHELLEGAITAVETGIAAVRPGVSGAELYKVVEDVVVDLGIATEQSPLMGHGHGIGLGFEWPFMLPFEQRRIQAGMVISVETMAGLPGVGSVYFEQNIVVTDDGVELLSVSPDRYW